jgi:hypothetical protein
MYGNYGGWGGLGGFPARNAVPNSQSVQSDQEFQNGWQQRLDAIPQYLQSGNITRTSDWQANQQRPFMGAPGGPGVQSMTAGQDYGQGSAGGVGTQSMTQDSNNGFRPMAVGGFGTQSVKRDNPDGITQVANPEWARVNQMMQDATFTAFRKPDAPAAGLRLRHAWWPRFERASELGLHTGRIRSNQRAGSVGGIRSGWRDAAWRGE